MTRIVGTCNDILLCNKCHVNLPLDSFSIKTYKDGRKKPYYSPHCKQCLASHAKQYRAENKNRLNMTIRDKRLKDPSRHRLANKKWAAANPEKSASNKKRYRAAKRGAPGSHTTEEWLNMVAKYNNTCPCCLEHCNNLTEDHIVPLVSGGSDNISNIQPLCPRCNSVKGSRHSIRYDMP